MRRLRKFSLKINGEVNADEDFNGAGGEATNEAMHLALIFDKEHAFPTSKKRHALRSWPEGMYAECLLNRPHILIRIVAFLP
jgi:hypothetical protein